MSRRQKVSAARRAAYWAARTAASEPPEDRAAAAWDWLRASINDMPSTQRKQAWDQVFGRLEGLRCAITDGEFTSGVHIRS